MYLYFDESIIKYIDSNNRYTTTQRIKCFFTLSPFFGILLSLLSNSIHCWTTRLTPGSELLTSWKPVMFAPPFLRSVRSMSRKPWDRDRTRSSQSNSSKVNGYACWQISDKLANVIINKTEIMLVMHSLCETQYQLTHGPAPAHGPGVRDQRSRERP